MGWRKRTPHLALSVLRSGFIRAIFCQASAAKHWKARRKRLPRSRRPSAAKANDVAHAGSADGEESADEVEIVVSEESGATHAEIARPGPKDPGPLPRQVAGAR